MSPIDHEIEISEAIQSNDLARLKELVLNEDTDLISRQLSLASHLGNLATVQLLIESGANVNWQNEDGESPLSFACSANNLDIAMELHRHGANPNLELSSGLTPLDIAVCWSSPTFREWLRNSGGRRNADYAEWEWPPPS